MVVKRSLKFDSNYFQIYISNMYIHSTIQVFGYLLTEFAEWVQFTYLLSGYAPFFELMLSLLMLWQLPVWVLQNQTGEKKKSSPMGQVQNDMGWVGVNTVIVANQNTHNISLQ